jgi:hypothetical protein
MHRGMNWKYYSQQSSVDNLACYPTKPKQPDTTIEIARKMMKKPLYP